MRFRRWLVCWGLIGLALAPSAVPAEPNLLARVQFLSAERLIRNNELQRADALIDELADYPLHAYLVEARFRQTIRSASEQDYLEVRRRLEGTPLAAALERRWLRQLARTGQWQKFLERYVAASHADLRCYHARALLESGRSAQAFEHAKSLWLVGKSQDPACDPVFQAWQNSGIPYSLRRQRLELAFGSGNRPLVRYLQPRLNETDRELASVWLDIRSDYRRALKFAERELPGLNSVLEAAVRRAIYRDVDGAEEMWETLSKRAEFDASGLAVHFAKVYVRQQRHRAAYRWFALVATDRLDPRARDLRIYNALALTRWHEALELIAGLPSDERTSEAWRFWRARALDATGQSAAARSLWAELAVQRSYYGYLSADRLGVPYRFNQRALEYDDAARRAVESTPTFVRLRELKALGRERGFRREWRYLIELPQVDISAATAAAHGQGWHQAAILTLAKTGQLDALEVRFPILFNDVLARPVGHNDLSLAWVLATIRQESAFMADVRSRAGAIGLMQIMPATGRGLARRHGGGRFHPARLVEPAYNVRLGTAYLRELLDQFEHPLLASASYNAGPHRIRRWRPKHRPMSADLWVETIPFDETRDYVKRIAYYRAIYAHRLGHEPERLERVFTDVQPAVPAQS